MSGLRTDPGFFIPGQPSRHAHTAGDRFYESLVAAHDGLTDAQSDLLQARLVLLLANHIGDLAVLEEALVLARSGVLKAAPP